MRLLTGVLLTYALVSQTTALEARPKDFIVDDFANSEGLSSIGTYWQFFSDSVMGGVSRGQAYLVPSDEASRSNVLRMRGTVSLENNGGFVQVRLPMADRNQSFKASKHLGIALNVRGNGERYFVHVRTSGTRAPWSYYYQSFPTTDEWARIELPFSAFRGENTGLGAFRTDRIVSIAIVAAKEKMIADLEVGLVALYR